MADITSLWAYDEILSNGDLGKSLSQFLSVFSETNSVLTRDEALYRVNMRFGKAYRMSSACGRIKELTDMGLLKKTNIIVNNTRTGHKVRTWRWTGNKSPEIKEQKRKCPCCGGYT
jgi:hypothetical protein